MESLFANYASSDDEEESRKPRENVFSGKLPNPSLSSSSLFSAIPQPRNPKTSSSKNIGGDLDSSIGTRNLSSSLFSAIPQPRNPKTSTGKDGGDLDSSTGTRNLASSLSSLPPPKSMNSKQSGSGSSDSVSAQRKCVVQIRLPVNPWPSNLEDEDDDEEEEKEREQTKSAASYDSSASSLLSAMPAPRRSATLGVLHSSGSGRKSIIDTEASAVEESGNDHNATTNENYQSLDHNNETNYPNYGSGVDQNAAAMHSHYGGYAGYDPNYSGSGDASYDPNASAGGDASGYVGYDGSISYGGNTGYGDQYVNTWSGGSFGTTTGLPEAVEAMDGAVKRARRSKKDVAPQIVEVKQDELMKNRPREDQVKSTGIAFGPAYQPASSKGKPSKLHKRKHQITALYFDMKQKETELAERRSKGFLTKAETQAKYGW